VRSSVPVAYLSAKLCDVFPDGTSALVSRGLLNLTHREGHNRPRPVEPGTRMDVLVRLDAAAHASRDREQTLRSERATYLPSVISPDFCHWSRSDRVAAS